MLLQNVFRNTAASKGAGNDEKRAAAVAIACVMMKVGDWGLMLMMMLTLMLLAACHFKVLSHLLSIWLNMLKILSSAPSIV